MLAILLACSAFTAAFTFSAAPAVDLEPLFQARASGWTGADVGTSVMLDNNGRYLWIFGDTLVGTVTDGRRSLLGRMFPRNSVAVLNNSGALPEPGVADVTFALRWDNSTSIQPESFFTAPPLPSSAHSKDKEVPSTTNWLWVFTGLVSNSSLYFLAGQFVNTSNPNFGFQQVSTVLLTVNDFSGDPLSWNYTRQYWTVSQEVTWCNAMVADGVDDAIWILGGVSVSNTTGPAGTVISRITHEDLRAGRLDKRLYLQEAATVEGRQWVPGPIPVSKLARLYSLSGETTLYFHPYMQRWFSLYFDGFLSPTIVMKSTNWLEHEWTTDVIYTVPPPFNNSSRIFCYAVKAHPELARAANEIVFTYETNSFNFEDVLEDSQIYVPRFVRVTISA